MILALAGKVPHWQPMTIVGSAVLFALCVVGIYVGLRPLGEVIRRREEEYDRIFRRALLLDISPRAITVGTGVIVVVLGFMGYVASRGIWGVLLLGSVGVFLPHTMIRYLRRRRLKKLEDQLVSGIQTLASGVRAGLNLPQSMALVARDAPSPLRQEFAHLMREYEYGISLDEAMRNSAERISSSDFRLLFAALHTHRERGGDLGETLDRIADSVREIQRLESQVQTLTAQGRATARWLGAMPIVIGMILYLIDADSVVKLFTEPMGNVIILAIVVLTVLGFLWIKKVVSIDI